MNASKSGRIKPVLKNNCHIFFLIEKNASNVISENLDTYIWIFLTSIHAQMKLAIM